MKNWRTQDGRYIPIVNLDDKHLDNIIHKIEAEAKSEAYDDALDDYVAEFKLADEEKETKRFKRERKLRRINNEPDYEIVWEKYLPKGYWDLIYEKRKRENILFR